MHRALRLHPDSRRNAVTRIDVEVTRTQPNMFALTYILRGRMNEAVLPEIGELRRQDELWRHTCLELFVALPRGYAEFNFSPSRAFAAYHFTGYREGMAPLEGVEPAIAVTPGADDYRLDVSLAVPGLGDGPVRIGLCAVVEETNGVISYWALDHGPNKPDFHHASAFALEI